MTALLAAAAPTPAGAQREWSPRRPERARAPTPYLEAAVNVAGWLSTLVLTGVSGRAAGIGFFFLRLNYVTRNPAYLGKARRAADYIASTQHPADAASELVQNPEFAAPVASRLRNREIQFRQ